MRRVSTRSRLLTGALACATVLGLGLPAQAEVFHSDPVRHRVIFVPRDKSLPFHLDERASKIVVAQPDTAAVIPTGSDSFYIQGKELGETNLLVYGASGRLTQVVDVRVGYDPQVLQDELGAIFPSENIRVRTLGPNLLLVGDVSDTGVSGRAQALAEKFAPGAWASNLTVRASQEVVLEVRVLEASRSVVHDMGISTNVQNGSFQVVTGRGLIGGDSPSGVLNLHGGSGSTSIDVQLAALENKGLIRTLARPNLVALSGEKATFLAGGEFPYPVPQSSGTGLATISIEFREYGVRLEFKPVVEANGLIRLEVAPEVSQLDPSNSLRVDGFSVPGLITRKTHTTVELRDGSALAIGGLFQHNYQNSVSQIPGVGSIPVLGGLFRSTRWQNNETELVIIITPRLAGAADYASAQATQSPPGMEPKPRDLLLRGDALDKPLVGDHPPADLLLRGDARDKPLAADHPPAGSH